MRKSLLILPLLSLVALAQYKYEPAGPPPEELAPAIREALQKTGHRIIAPNGSVFAELWFRAQAPSGPATNEEGVSLTTVPHGSLLGAIRFPGRGADRRGQTIKAGVYTLRLAYYPLDGAHQGIAPQRDFLKIIPAAEDKDLNATPSYDELVAMSNKASGTSHPATLSVWKLDKAEPAGLHQHEGDWILHATIGDIPIAVIVVGVFQG
jgi:hypothetical protein